VVGTHEKFETQNCWYALRTKSRHEKIVCDRLASFGLEPLLPTIKRVSQWKDRRKEIDIPLFSGYCFLRFSIQRKLPVLMTPGVVEVVGGGNRPEPIPDEEIEALKKLMESVLPYDTHPYLHEGMTVEVIRGPLQGLRGILLRKEKLYRLVLGVHLLQRAAAVKIDVADVVPI